jgi:hypothetical protein
MKLRASKSRLPATGLVLVLAGCLPSPNGDAQTLVADTQAAAVAACQFEPATSSILQLLAGNHPGLAAASQIAQAICDLVIDRRLTGGGRGGEVPLILEGVVIEGRNISQTTR